MDPPLKIGTAQEASERSASYKNQRLLRLVERKPTRHKKVELQALVVVALTAIAIGGPVLTLFLIWGLGKQ